MKRPDFVVPIGAAVACPLVTNAMKDGRFGPGTELKKHTQLRLPQPLLRPVDARHLRSGYCQGLESRRPNRGSRE